MNNAAYYRKQSFALEHDVKALIHHFGQEQCGMLTLTFPERVTPQSANQAWAIFRKRLAHVCECFISVMDVSGCGCIHYHVVVAFNRDVKGKFDSSAHNAIRTIEHRARGQGRKLSESEKQECKSLSTTLNFHPALRYYRKAMKKNRIGSGFGKILDLSPIRKDAESVANYMVKAYGTIVRFKQTHPGKFRTIFRSQSLPEDRRLRTTSFSLLSKGACRWRRSLSRVAVFLDTCPGDNSPFKERWGSRWCWTLNNIFDAMRNVEGFDPDNWTDDMISAYVLK